MTEIDRLFVAGKDFNTNLVRVSVSQHVIISNLHVCSFTDMISHMHRCKSCVQKIIIFSALVPLVTLLAKDKICQRLSKAFERLVYWSEYK